MYFAPLGEGGKLRGLMPLALFLLPRRSGRGLVIPIFSGVFLGGLLTQTSARPKKYSLVIFLRLASIRQNFHESWRRNSLAIGWHKNPFVENKNEDANEL